MSSRSFLKYERLRVMTYLESIEYQEGQIITVSSLKQFDITDNFGIQDCKLITYSESL